MAAWLGHCCPSMPSELQCHDNVNEGLALRGPNDLLRAQWLHSADTAVWIPVLDEDRLSSGSSI